jgi:hypothetical protein
MEFDDNEFAFNFKGIDVHYYLCEDNIKTSR